MEHMALVEIEAGKRITGQDLSEFPLGNAELEQMLASAKDSYNMLGGFLSLPR
jgi:hypothetical protein